MREFLLNAIGYATVVAMIGSIIYTWGKLNMELKKLENLKQLATFAPKFWERCFGTGILYWLIWATS